MKNEIRNNLNKVKLSYTKTVIYHKDGEVLTKFDPEVFESWLKEEVETEEDIEDIERNIDEVIEEYDQRNKDSGWTEVNTTFENSSALVIILEEIILLSASNSATLFISSSFNFIEISFDILKEMMICIIQAIITTIDEI